MGAGKPDTLTIRPRSIAIAIVWVALLTFAGLTTFGAVGATMALADDIGVALFFAVLAALFGWSGWNLWGHIHAFQRTRAIFRDREVTVVRVRASTGQHPRFETITVDLGRIVRLGYREYWSQGLKGIPVTHACAWVEDGQGRRTVLASGDDARATFAKRVADEVERRTGLASTDHCKFRFVGMFGAVEITEAPSSISPPPLHRSRE